MRVVICDNELKDTGRLETLLKEFAEAHTEMQIEWESFSLASELLKAMEKKEYDVYFLDILMPEMDGMELGREIRRQNRQAVIVYVTVSREFAFEAYGIHAFRYLEKPVQKNDVWELMETLGKIEDRKKETMLGIRTRKGITKVCTEDIICIENVFRAAVYVMRSGERLQGICNRGSFESSVEPLSCHPNFIHPHKSYFVNIDYIQTLSSNQMILENGMQIPISRKRYADIKSAYLKFLAEGSRME